MLNKARRVVSYAAVAVCKYEETKAKSGFGQHLKSWPTVITGNILRFHSPRQQQKQQQKQQQR